MNAEPLWRWINERHAIYLRKCACEGAMPPRWAVVDKAEIPAAEGISESLIDPVLTADPILARYRFTNVFRELDRVTIWIRENIREPFADHEHLWFMLAIARCVNWPPTLRELMDAGAWPSAKRFTPGLLGERIVRRRDRGEKVETGAYMIRAESDTTVDWYDWPKARYIAEVVLGRIWQDRAKIEAQLTATDRLERAWALFAGNRRYRGWGPFMAYELVTDLRHTRYLRDAADIDTWANAGPGAIRGLCRLTGRKVAPNGMSSSEALELMRRLLRESSAATAHWVPKLELRDVEHSLCETDKYLRARSGEGRPRARYVPGRGY